MKSMDQAKTKSRRAGKTRVRGPELDSVYLLKLALYLIIGAQWIRFQNGAGTTQIPIPVGLLIGILFALHDHFKIDRKIEFAEGDDLRSGLRLYLRPTQQKICDQNRSLVELGGLCVSKRLTHGYAAIQICARRVRKRALIRTRD